jgi:hypothetical protein
MMIMSENTNLTKQKIKLLALEEAYIFIFYFAELERNALDRFPGKVGSVVHLNFLIQESSADPSLKEIYEALLTTKLNTFSGKAKKMVGLAQQCKAAGINPTPFLPTALAMKQPPSLSQRRSQATDEAPKCPHTQAQFQHYDYQRRPTPGIVNLFAHRCLLSSLITKEDIKYTWMTPTWLQVRIKYPDVMNYPVQLCPLVTDGNRQQVFHEQHDVIIGFEKDLSSRREKNGFPDSVFDIRFENDQDPTFVSINTKLKGFDLLRSKYVNADNELCYFKILQIITKDKDNDEYREGGATEEDCPTVMSAFSTPQKAGFIMSPQQQQPTPSHTYSSPTPVYSSPAPHHPTSDKTVADLSAQLQSAMKMIEESKVEIARATNAAANAQAAAQKATTEQEQIKQAAIAEITKQQQIASAAQQLAAQHHAVAAEQHVAAQAAQAEAREAAAQREATISQAKMATIAQVEAAKETALLATASKDGEQQAIVSVRAELQATKAAAVAAIEQSRRETEVAQQVAVQLTAAQQEADERAAIATAQEKIGTKRTRRDPDQHVASIGGLHGSDGQFHAGVPVYVGGSSEQMQEENRDEFSTIASGYAG